LRAAGPSDVFAILTMAKRKLNVAGQELWGESVDFETDKESWNSYILHDGTTLKLKTVLAEVFRVEGLFDPNGQPTYVVNANPVMSVDAPDNLKKK
jgi:hypothetical protein